MTFYRAMSAKDKSYAVSIHEIDEFWDAGPVLFKKFGSFDYRRCFLHSIFDAGKQSGKFLLDSLQKFLFSKNIPGITQDAHQYWSFPTKDEIKKGEGKGIVIYNHQKILYFYMKIFLTNSTSEKMDLFTKKLINGDLK